MKARTTVGVSGGKNTMKDRLVSLLATTLVATAVAVPAAVSPAAADTNLCVGHGTATTGPLVYPVTATTAPMVTVRQPWTVGFAFTIALGTCAPDLGKSLTATGWIRGWCGLSSGQGVTGNGHRFNWIEAGGVAVITGELDGIAHVVPDPTVPGNSCLTGATTFLVTLGVVSRHCGFTKTKGLTDVGPLPSTLTTTLPVSIHTGPWGVHWKLCG